MWASFSKPNYSKLNFKTFRIQAFGNPAPTALDYSGIQIVTVKLFLIILSQSYHPDPGHFFQACFLFPKWKSQNLLDCDQGCVSPGTDEAQSWI